MTFGGTVIEIKIIEIELKVETIADIFIGITIDGTIILPETGVE